MQNIDTNLLNDIITYNKKRKQSNLQHVDFEVNKDYERILSARYMKISRIKKDIVYLFHTKRYIWFLTFTFSDSYLKKSDRTKRDLIKHSLQGFDFKYILNVDYGKNTGREHYHALLGTDFSIDLNEHLKFSYPDFTDARVCYRSDEDKIKLCKYIHKLSNHCCKDTTKLKRIYKNFKSYPLTTNEKQKTELYKSWFFSEFGGF